MKTITKVYNLYTIDELDEKAKETAYAKWVEGNDYYFLSDYLDERLHELLEEKGITDTNDTSKAGTKPTRVQYSLSYCQGDGAMFEGVFMWNGYTVKVKHSGHYTHYNSKTIDIYKEEENGEEYNANDDVLKEFDDLYKTICKELERQGYDFIEYEDSMEAFEQACEANEYTFTIDGVIDNQ